MSNYPRARIEHRPFRSLFDHDDDPMTCQCGWRGTRQECHERAIHSDHPLAARDGYEYLCPHCGLIISASYTKVS